MKNNNIIWVRIDTTSYFNLLIKLNDIGINIYDNKKYHDYILIKISYKDYQKIRKYLVSYNSSIDSVLGLPKFKNIVKKYIIFVLSNIMGIILLILANNMIFKIEIKSPDQNIQKLLLKELEKYNLKTMSLKKPHLEIEKVVKNILDNNKETLEWLEIRYDGLIMIVNVVEKNKEDIKNEQKHCDIIAKTDAKISSMNIYRGVALKEINDYVNKDDVIISGSIIHNEEVKNTVCASGIIYGEVWYQVNIEYPLKEEYISYSGKNRYNLNIFYNNKRHLVFKSRLKNKEEEDINIYKLNNFEINIVKEKEYVKKERILTEDEAYNKAIKEALDKVKLKLNENEEIMLQKVLKKSINDSTIYLEIFVVTKESIGYTKVIEEVVESEVKSSFKNN